MVSSKLSEIKPSLGAGGPWSSLFNLRGYHVVLPQSRTDSVLWSSACHGTPSGHKAFPHLFFWLLLCPSQCPMLGKDQPVSQEMRNGETLYVKKS